MKSSFHIAAGALLVLTVNLGFSQTVSEKEMDRLLHRAPSTDQAPASSSAQTPASRAPTVADPGARAPNKLSTSEHTSDNPFILGIQKARYETRAVTYAFPSTNPGQKPGDDTKQVQGHGRATMDAAFDFTKRFRMKVDARLEYGSEDDTYRFENPFSLDDNKRTRGFDLDQLYLRNRADNLELILGKQRLDLGVNTLYSPANGIAPVDGSRPMDPIKLGVLQATAAWHVGSSSAEVHYIPFFQESKSPSPTSRWSAPSTSLPLSGNPSYASYDFRNVDLKGYTVNPTEDNVFDRTDEPNFLVREKVSVGGLDLFAQGYYGFLAEPLLRVQQGLTTTVQKTYVRGFMPAAGLATTVGKVGLRTEVAAMIPNDRENDTLLNPAIEAEYDLNSIWKNESIDHAKLTLAYSYQVRIQDQNNPSYPINTREVRPGRNSVYLLYDIAFLKDWRAFWGTTANASGRFDYTCRVGGEYKFKEGWSTTLSFQHFGGDKQSSYGEWSDNEFVMLEVVKKF